MADRSWLFHPTPASRRATVAVFLNVAVAPDVVHLAWEAAGYRVAADGAANRLLAHTPPLFPDVVCGDLDSATGAALDACAAAGVQVVRVQDQDTTDLFKCLQVVVAGGGGWWWWLPHARKWGAGLGAGGRRQERLQVSAGSWLCWPRARAHARTLTWSRSSPAGSYPLRVFGAGMRCPRLSHTHMATARGAVRCGGGGGGWEAGVRGRA
jgi:thiamine pyrophosphokinase